MTDDLFIFVMCFLPIFILAMRSLNDDEVANEKNGGKDDSV